MAMTQEGTVLIIDGKKGRIVSADALAIVVEMEDGSRHTYRWSTISRRPS